MANLSSITLVHEGCAIFVDITPESWGMSRMEQRSNCITYALERFPDTYRVEAEPQSLALVLIIAEGTQVGDVLKQAWALRGELESFLSAPIDHDEKCAAAVLAECLNQFWLDSEQRAIFECPGPLARLLEAWARGRAHVAAIWGLERAEAEKLVCAPPYQPETAAPRIKLKALIESKKKGLAQLREKLEATKP